MKNTRLVFMGTPLFAVPILEALIEKYDVVGVVTQPDKEKPSPIKETALKNNIKVFQPIKIKNEYEDILKLNPDIIITCAYGQIIPKIVLDYPKYGCINVHASLLPKLRGGAPIHRAILDGYDKTGITIMYMDESMDTGDIISSFAIDIGPDETVGSLHDRLMLVGKDLLISTLPNILNGNINRIKQNNEQATYAYNIKREDEKINWDDSATNIYNKIRGLNPFPGCYTLLDDKILKIWNAKIISGNSNEENGKIINLEDGIHVKAKDGYIVITSLQLEGKKKLDYKEFINGRELLGKVLR